MAVATRQAPRGRTPTTPQQYDYIVTTRDGVVVLKDTGEVKRFTKVSAFNLMNVLQLCGQNVRVRRIPVKVRKGPSHLGLEGIVRQVKVPSRARTIKHFTIAVKDGEKSTMQYKPTAVAVHDGIDPFIPKYDPTLWKDEEGVGFDVVPSFIKGL